jgi:hypothetical protein
LPLVTVHFGQFRTHPVAMPLAKPGPGKRRTARVLKTEEKGSDVNLARRTCSWTGWTIFTSRPWSSRMTLILRLRSGRRTVASAPSTSSVRVARHRRQLGRRRLIRCHTRDPRGHRSTRRCSWPRSYRRRFVSPPAAASTSHPRGPDH